MLPYFLNVIYFLAALLASPWLLYQALTKGKYREGFAAKLFGLVPRRGNCSPHAPREESGACDEACRQELVGCRNRFPHAEREGYERPCIWLHAVSVGEVNLLKPLIEELERRFPDWDCVISTTTMTGYALARKKYGAERVFYAPLDFTWAVAAAMRRIRPSLLVLAELELWPNLIRAAKQHGAHVAVINGRLSERSFRGYQRVKRLIGPVLQQIDLIAVQTEEYAGRFRELGANSVNVRVTGSLKFDGAQTNRHNLETVRLARLAGFREEDIVFLAGSTQDPEEALTLESYRQLAADHPRLRLVLVPRHPDRFDAVARLLDQSGLPWQRRSALETAADPQARVLLIDCVGELSAWWGTAQIAFVGGSLGSRGGQNMIEPAAYGAAVSYGPDTRNFRDIVAALAAAEAAIVVHDGPSLTQFVRQALEHPEFTTALGQRAAALVQRHQGATAHTVDLLEPLLAKEVVVDCCGEKAA